MDGRNETANYDFIVPSKTCQRHLKTRAAQTSEMSSKAIKHLFNKILVVFADFFTANTNLP